MPAESVGTQVRVVFGGALRLVMGQAETTVRVSHGMAPTVEAVMDALTAGLAGSLPMGVNHCLAIVNSRVVPRGEWAGTVLANGAMVSVYPPLAGGAPDRREADSPGRRSRGCRH